MRGNISIGGRASWASLWVHR